MIPTYDGTNMVGPTADEVADPKGPCTTVSGARRVLADAHYVLRAKQVVE